MISYVSRRLVGMFLTTLLATFLIYGCMQLVPGDPVIAMFYPDVPDPERMAVLREQLGLNRPFPVRYLGWLYDAFHGDLGESFKQNRPVAQIIAKNVPPTFQLAALSMVFAIVIGLGTGILAAILKTKFFGSILMVLALFGVSAPMFWVGLLLIFGFSLHLEWFPSYGTGGIARLILPAITLGLYCGGFLARFTRSSILDVKSLDYVLTARAKGLSELIVNTKHILRNAMIPIVTIAGYLAVRIFGGAVICEIVFARAGIGNLLVQAIIATDYPLVQGLLVVVTGITIAINFLVDMSYAYIDPRVQYA